MLQMGNIVKNPKILAAKLTFGNVIILSILFTLIDYLRRKFTTERITKRIAGAAGFKVKCYLQRKQKNF